VITGEAGSYDRKRPKEINVQLTDEEGEKNTHKIEGNL